MFWIILILVLILLFMYWRKFKHLKLPNMVLINGGLKTGKSCLSVYLALRVYKQNLFKYKLSNFFIRLFKRLRIKKYKNIEENPYPPMLYSNMKILGVKMNPLTLNILLRQVRIPNKSVVLIDEASLVADSMLYKDKDLNNVLMYFVKLFAHYSHGGSLIINTQSISDLHFNFKRCVSNYLYIYSKSRLPFISLFKIQDLYYSEDNSSVNVNVNGDIEDMCKCLVVRNSYFKKYDIYYYSVLTDNLEYEVDYNKEVFKFKSDLKAEELLTLHNIDFKNFFGGVKK